MNREDLKLQKEADLAETEENLKLRKKELKEAKKKSRLAIAAIVPGMLLMFPVVVVTAILAFLPKLLRKVSRWLESCSNKWESVQFFCTDIVYSIPGLKKARQYSEEMFSKENELKGKVAYLKDRIRELKWDLSHYDD